MSMQVHTSSVRLANSTPPSSVSVQAGSIQPVGLQDGHDLQHVAATGSAPTAARPPAASVALLRRALLHLITPGTGQYRSDVARGAQRAWNDFHLTSHCALVPGIVCASRPNGLPELAVLQTAVLLLSLAYHRNYERPGLLSMLEGTSAKLLFLYGTMQTARSPSSIVLLANCTLALATLGFFLLTNLDKVRFYDHFHPFGLHIVPGLWSLVVATSNDSLILAFRAKEPS